MHFYQFHIGDYKSHTHHLSPMEDLAFRRLLDHYYLHETPIRQRDIARQIGLRDYEQEVLTVLDEFFISTENGYIHTRADEEIAKYRKLSDDGKRGAAKRWQKGGDSPPNATPIATKNQEPITKNHNKATVVATPVGVSESVWKDFLALRKSKKAPLTNTALEGLMREATKAKMTLEQVLSTCCERGWGGFKADWMVGQAIRVNPADIARVTVPSTNQPDPALLKIEKDRQKAVPIPENLKAKISELTKGFKV